MGGVEAGAERTRGAAGVDRQTLDAVEEYGVERLLDELQRRASRRHVSAGAGAAGGHPEGRWGERPLGIPTVRDRVAQMAAKLVLEPIFEADFLPVSYGFRPKRRATQALEILRERRSSRGTTFCRRRHPRLLRRDRPRQADGAGGAARLGPAGAQAGAAVARGRGDGARQGRAVDGWHAAGRGDLAAAVEHLPACARSGVRRRCARRRWCAMRTTSWWLCRSEAAGEAGPASGRARCWPGWGWSCIRRRRGLVELREGREGFDFLGCHLSARVSGRLLERGVRRYFLQRWPSPAGDEADPSEDQGADRPQPGRDRTSAT